MYRMDRILGLAGRVDKFTIIPAYAGIYACRLHHRSRGLRRRIPACAGMTVSCPAD